MKLKLSQIVSAQPSLRKLTAMDLPMRTAFRITKMTKRMDSDLSSFEEQRIGLFRKHGTETDGRISVPDSNMQRFQADMTELMSIEVDLDIEKVELQIDPAFRISPQDIMNLDPFIEFKE